MVTLSEIAVIVLEMQIDLVKTSRSRVCNLTDLYDGNLSDTVCSGVCGWISLS